MECDKMHILILKGKTRKGKTRIREMGDRWIVDRTVDNVIYDSEKVPHHLIYPESMELTIPSQRNKHSRWIRCKDDPDFEIIGDCDDC